MKTPQGRRAARRDVGALEDELCLNRTELDARSEELERAQLHAERTERMYSEVFDSAPAAYLTIDATGVIASANAAACQLLATGRQRPMGLRVGVFVAESSWNIFGESMEALQQHGRASCELQLKRWNNTQCTVRMDLARTGGRTGACLMSFTDLSDRQRQREVFEHSKRELEDRVAQCTAALEKQQLELQLELQRRERDDAERKALQARLRELEPLHGLGLCAAGIAHDFNGLLTGLLVSADVLLQAPELPEALRGPLSIIVRTAGDATELTRQLLAPAHASNQEKHAIDLARVVANCVEVALIRAGNAVQLQTQLEAELPPIAANRLQVQRLVMNILTNALEAVGNHGVVCVGAHVEALDAGALAHFQHASAAQPGAFAILSISDTGPGIDAERLSRIFEPFETSKSAGRGLGLGIVLEIVRNYGGALRVRSHLGQGTRFDIAFPLATSVPAPQSATPARAHTRQFSGSLLLIDDDRLVSVAMARALSTLGFEITLAEDGTRGLATFMESERAFDIVVLDWLMPGLCGEQLFAELRRARPTLPIVLVSGFGPDRLPIGDAFTARVQKPFSLDELRETFRRLLSPRPQRCEPPMPPMTAA